MLSKKFVRSLVIGSLMTGLIGCSTSGNKLANRDNTDDYSATNSNRIADSIEFYEEEITPAEELRLLSTNTLYFGYDKFDITSENKKVIFAHAKKLIENPNLKLRVDGHTAARGSSEYNIGLGERRAKAVAQVLALKGIATDRVITVSYGKEKPAIIGIDDIAWGKNRRAEMEYEGS